MQNMSSRKKRKTTCVHYHYVGDYGLETCTRRGIGSGKEELDFDCSKCQHYRTHSSGLEPCPFCGGKPYLSQTYSYKNEWEVMCRKCHARIKAVGVDETAEKWNARKPT